VTPQQQQQQQRQQQYYCQADDQCCPLSLSPADCSSTDSRNRGCKSHTSCAPKDNPCAAATNSSSCSAAGAYCRFSEAAGACLLDSSQHPCANLAVHTGECAAAAACTAAHVCRDTCATCARCLQATRKFDQLPKILRGMSATGDYRQHAEAISFFKVG
jgi:hypothetical protein